MAASVFALWYFAFFVCQFSLLLRPSGEFHQRGISKHLIVLSCNSFSGFHQTRNFYKDFGRRGSGSLWDLPETQKWGGVQELSSI